MNVKLNHVNSLHMLVPLVYAERQHINNHKVDSEPDGDSNDDYCLDPFIMTLDEHYTDDDA